MTKPSPVVLLQALQESGADALVAAIRSVDCGDLWNSIAKARDAAIEAGNVDRAAAYDALAGASSMILCASEPLRAFAPLLQMTFGSSAGPDAYRGAQAEIFAAFAPTVAHPALRARLADLGWYLAKRPDAGRLAIRGYLDCLQSLLGMRGGRGGARSAAALDLLRRACVIQRQLGWVQDDTTLLIATARKVREQARRHGDASGFVAAVELALDFRLASPSALAKASEKFAATSGLHRPDHAQTQVWETAARAYSIAERKGDADRTVAALAECHVRTADRFAKSPMHEAHWLEEAIAVLRRFKGTNERRAELQARLVRAQGRIGEIMAPPRGRIDVHNLADLTRKSLAGLDRTASLLLFAEQSRSPDITGLRAAAAESLARTPFAGLFAPRIFDPKFKLASRLPAIDFGQSPDEGNLRHQILQHEELRRILVAGGQIEPARIQIVLDHQPDERVLTRLAALSPRVPHGHASFFGRGFAHFFNADFVEAAHLLVLQLEPLLRHLLVSADVDITRFKPDQTQSSATLSLLLKSDGPYRETLEAMLGEAAVFEIENLFDRAEGPALRHRIAHGLYSPWAYAGHDIRYACWFLYRLCVEPLRDHADYVREHLDS